MASNVLLPSETTESWRNWCSGTDFRIAQQWNADGVTASRLTTYRRVNEMGCANRTPQVKPLLNFKQCKKRLTWTTEKRYWTVGQWSRAIFSDESKFCVSFRNRGPRVWRKPYEADKSSCTKCSIKLVWRHHGEECQQLELDLRVFCEQMSLLLSIKKSWSIFCFRWLSNCLEVTSSHSNTTWQETSPLRPKP